MYKGLVAKLNTLFPKDRLEKFFYGPIFPIYVALIATLSFATSAQLVGLLFFSISATIIFLRFRDVTPIMPLLAMVVLCFRNFSVMGSILPYVFLFPAMFAFVARFFIYPVKNFKPGKLFFPLIGVSIALFLGGILSDQANFIGGIATASTIGPVILVIYLFFSAYVTPPKNFDLKMYICYVLVIVGLTTLAHLAIYHLHTDVLRDNSFFSAYLGWGNLNSAGALMLLALGACWYLLTRVKNILAFFVLLILLYFGIFISNSDGVLGIALIFTPILVLFTYCHVDRFHRAIFVKIVIITVILLLTACAIVVLCYGYDNLMEILIPHFSDSSGTKLYKEALELFAKYPFFGVGFGYGQMAPEISMGIVLYNFHSVLFHVMATMGLIGVTAYFFYYIERFKILMQHYNCFTLFMTITFMMFECYAFIDTCEFNAIPIMSTLTLLFVVVEHLNKKSNDQTLPLYIRPFNKTIF